MNERTTQISVAPEVGEDCAEDVLIGLGILETPVPFGEGRQELVSKELSAHAIESAKKASTEKCTNCLGRSSCALWNIGRMEPITQIFFDANSKGDLEGVKADLKKGANYVEIKDSSDKTNHRDRPRWTNPHSTDSEKKGQLSLDF